MITDNDIPEYVRARSNAYQQGFVRGLMGKIDSIVTAYKLGTPEHDAFWSGADHGAEYRQAGNNEHRARD